MSQLVEFNLWKRGKILVNPDKIAGIVECVDQYSLPIGRCIIYFNSYHSSASNLHPAEVHHTLEEVKKRLGMTISPRAETLAIAQ